MNKRLLLCAALLSSTTLQAAQSDRFIQKVSLPSGQTVVVEEGAYESRSIGSFSVRLYDAAPLKDATTFFAAGIICARDGTIENVVLADVDGNRRPEIIVNVRSAGTGGYISSHAFAFDKNTLILRAEVDNLPPNADPVASLRKTIEKEK